MPQASAPPVAATPHVIIIDWGTTSLRATLVDAAGTAIAALESLRGIQAIPAGAFAPELMQTIGPWLDRYGALPVIALGMITSRNGWVEVPYVPCPATARDLAAGAVHRRLPNGSDLILLPGLTDHSRHPFPDVMRGEETQIVGYGLDGPATLVLPGTHSKWARLAEGRIAGFQTFVTGEVFALLSQHSFIAKAAGTANATANWSAFERGVQIARDTTGSDAAFLTQIFSARTGMLADQLNPADLRDHVSGLLIGAEFRQARDAGWFTPGERLGIVGNDGLNARYGRAARVFGLIVADGGTAAAIHGALEIFALLETVPHDPD
ncbi:MAG: 2-dehydro-3-deoxygalactonokinase [Qingshengfaniella sp.]